MPIEYMILKDRVHPQIACPMCGAFPLRPFLRGAVQRWPYGLSIKWVAGLPLPWIGRRPYCAIICDECKEIVGYEEP